MPANHRVPSYRFHKATGQAIVVLDGRSHYLGPWSSAESRAEYDRLLAEWFATGRRSRVAKPTATAASCTIVEMILAFWRHAEVHYRAADGTPSGELINLKVALKPLRALYGDSLARDFGPMSLRAVRQKMVDEGLARTSVNARIERIRRAFRWAASVELVPGGVVEALATVAGLQKGRTNARESDPVGPVAMELVEATLPHLSRTVAGMVRLQLLTGMRPGEACLIRGRDLTPGDGVWTYRPGSHKSAWRGKNRAIAVGPKALEILREFAKPDPDAYLFDPRDAVAEHQAARSSTRKSRPTPSETTRRAAKPGSSRNRRYSRMVYRNAIIRACDRAFPHPTIRKLRGKPLSDADRVALVAWKKSYRWHPNQLRHTLATEVRARFGLEASQAVLGHAKADVTQVYAERDLNKAIEVMRQLG